LQLNIHLSEELDGFGLDLGSLELGMGTMATILLDKTLERKFGEIDISDDTSFRHSMMQAHVLNAIAKFATFFASFIALR
jgi:hypothetical protein